MQVQKLAYVVLGYTAISSVSRPPQKVSSRQTLEDARQAWERKGANMTFFLRLLLASSYCVCTAGYLRWLVQDLRVGWPRLLAVAPLVLTNFAMPALFEPVQEGPAILICVLVLMFLHTFKVRLAHLQIASDLLQDMDMTGLRASDICCFKTLAGRAM